MRPKFRTVVEPRFSDFDLQGILNSRQYLDLVGEARVDQMKRCYGTPMEDYVAKGQTFVVQSFQIDYDRPIHYGTRFNIETWVEEMKGPMALVCFKFINTEGTVTYAHGSGKYFLIDLRSKKPVEFSEGLRKIYLGE